MIKRTATERRSVRTRASTAARTIPIVITIGDLTEMQIETTDLSERDIPKVKIGQSATINIDALDQEVNGRVSRIAEQASSVGGDVVYTVIISLDEEIPEARWGMSAEIKIAVEG